MPDHDEDLIYRRGGTMLSIFGKGFASAPFEGRPADNGIDLPHPHCAMEPECPGEPLLTRVRHLTESVNDTPKRQRDLGWPSGSWRWPAAIRRNHDRGVPMLRSLSVHDH